MGETAPLVRECEGERKLRLTLEYEGTAYAGFQVQKGQPTVQAAVEEAFRSLSGERRRLAAAGRTDAGVHAKGQVVTFRTRSRLPLARIVTGINHYLPRDIVVVDGSWVELAFDPRRHAWSRTYRYTVLNRRARSSLWRRFAYHCPGELDVEKMQEAARLLVGKMDYRSFAAESGERFSAVRQVYRADVWREGELVLLEMEASGYLRQQVRRTAGALVRVGRGDLTVEAFHGMLCSPEQGAASWALPPEGLCLMSVTYLEKSTVERHEDL